MNEPFPSLHTSAPRGGRLAVTLPVVATVVIAIGLLLDTACSCDPGPVMPTMDSCSNPGTNWDGVTGIEIVGARFVAGIQGGNHFEFQIDATGTDLPTCVAYEGRLEVSGSSPTGLAGAVPAEPDGAGAIRTRTIYLFDPPSQARLSSTLTVTALGHTAVVELGLARDAGADAGRADAGTDAGELDADLDANLDAGELDAGELDAGDLDAGDLDADLDAALDAGEADAP